MAGDGTGIVDSGKSDGDGNKVGGQATASRVMARLTRPIPTTMFDVRGGGRQWPSFLRALQVTFGGQLPGPCHAVP